MLVHAHLVEGGRLQRHGTRVHGRVAAAVASATGGGRVRGIEPLPGCNSFASTFVAYTQYGFMGHVEISSLFLHRQAYILI